MLKLILLIFTFQSIAQINKLIPIKLNEINYESDKLWEYEEYDEISQLNPSRFKSKEYIQSLHDKSPNLYYKIVDNNFLLYGDTEKELKKNACDTIRAIDYQSKPCNKIVISKVNNLYEVNLSPFISKRVNEHLTNQTHQNRIGPNCFNTAMYIRNLDNTIKENGEIDFKLDYYCKPVTSSKDLKAGDIGTVWYYGNKEIETSIAHAFVYINDDLVFQKATGMPEDRARLTSMTELVLNYGSNIYRKSDLFMSKEKINYDKTSVIKVPYIDVSYDDEGNALYSNKKILDNYGSYIKYYRCPTKVELNEQDVIIKRAEAEMLKAIKCYGQNIKKEEVLRLDRMLEKARRELQAYMKVHPRHYRVLIETLGSLNSDLMWMQEN